jgi:hypothetical protein
LLPGIGGARIWSIEATATAVNPPPAPRQGLGSFFRLLLDYLDDEHLRARVRERVSPETQHLFDSPPRALAFIPSTPIDEVEIALGEVAGTDALVDCGLQTARALGGSLILPAIRAAFFLFGESPASLFANLDRFFSLVTRGIAFSWKDEGPAAGVIEVRFQGPDTPRAAFHILRGTLQFVYEISATRGQVDPPEIVSESSSGAVIHFRVRW